MVINIDAFAKDENIINKPNDKLTGKKPVEFIQSSKPIVIVDEPQNMETAIRKLMIDGIKYEKIGNKVYEMQLFEDNELDIYLDQYTFKINNADKTIYENFIPLDSGTENQFARDCETSEIIEFFFKLPFWFKIPTPIGNYNPDWAIVFKGERKIYFVAETKSEGQELRGTEKMKIKCGTEHFRNFEEVIYKQVSKVSELSIT